ncbi:ATP-binding protein [Streptomyces sp. NPDC018000]|uniref:ATP-binding protein n=1 Tax=Streptomyces sp. NPDC018000 TaxID=3365028 RepID=UPI0037A67F8A
MPWRRTWVCPHCFRSISRTRIAYVCVSGAAACADDRGLASAAPRAGSAVCGTCGRTTTRLRCTACAGRLPEGYLRTPGKLVALAGPVSSGKSTYIGVLVHELLHRLGAELDAALLPCDDDTMADYHERYERHLYEEQHTVPKTAEHDAGRPLVHRLSRTRRGRFGRARKRVLTLVFLDTAGEHFTSRDRIETQLRYFAAADAVVVLVDPQDLPGAPVKNGDGVPGRSGEVLARVLGHLGGGRKVTVPVAVALTKADLLWPHLPGNSPLHSTRRPGPVFDADDRAAVHAELQALLRRWQEHQLDARLDQFCTDYQLFALSTLGTAPRHGGGLGLGGIVRPHRVEDPLMWLLHRFGALDRGRG